MQPIRIQKALSEAGVASRRAAEELVRQLNVNIAAMAPRPLVRAACPWAPAAGR